VDIHGRAYLFSDVCGYSAFTDTWVEIVEDSVALVMFFDTAMLERAPCHIAAMYRKVGPVVVRRRLPTLVLVNRAEAGMDLGKLEVLTAENLFGVPVKIATIAGFDSQALQLFEWLESQIA
jgi:hypothetical protein